MLFGPTNGPATFVTMIHDVDSVWKNVASSNGLNVDTNVDTRVIIDDIVNFAKSFNQALQYMEC